MSRLPDCCPQDASPKMALEALSFIGRRLHRPECVLCTRRGDICTRDWRGGGAHILPDGTQRLYRGTLSDGRAFRPNGISPQADGSFLTADLGDEAGGVFRVDRDGTVSAFLDKLDGVTLPPTNFVFTDPVGRTWITVSTRRTPRAVAYRGDVADGFIVMVDRKRPRVVTDGLAFDAKGGAWITSIISNRIIHVAPDGRQRLMLEDVEANYVAWVEAAFQHNELGRSHRDHSKSRYLKNLSSLAFGRSDLHTAYLGNLQGDTLAYVALPFAGHPLIHWNYH